jgi:hypothetical protein
MMNAGVCLERLGLARDSSRAYELPFLQCIIVTFSSGTARPCA